MFTKTSKSAPSDEVSKNAQLLIRAGFVYKEMAGVFAYLPLGLKVLENIKQIIREELNKINSQELIMTNLQPKETWETTTRWDDEVVDIWFKTKMKDDTELGLAWSHEEPIMKMLSGYVHSYKDLSTSVYQFQTKLRNELRAKSGIMRGREFMMKDMYSIHSSSQDLDAYYNEVADTYKRIFERLGIGEDTYITYASGGAFTKFSHEFQTVCDAGEDIMYLHREKNIAVNEEVLDDAAEELEKLGVSKGELEKVKSAEVGNIFNFGTEKAEQMNIKFTDKNGELKPLYLGSYGIGVTRVMGVIAEKMSDNKGLVWPENIAPAKVYLINIEDDENVVKFTTEIYEKLQNNGIDVIWDDRKARAGEKFADSDLMGIPYRVVISKKLDDKIEIKKRTSEESDTVALEELLGILK
jgi:Prolyl-tRNA synthetase